MGKESTVLCNCETQYMTDKIRCWKYFNKYGVWQICIIFITQGKWTWSWIPHRFFLNVACAEFVRLLPLRWVNFMKVIGGLAEVTIRCSNHHVQCPWHFIFAELLHRIINILSYLWPCLAVYMRSWQSLN